jgi:hypothetical protein
MPSNLPVPVRALSDAQLKQFVQDGFVRLDGAFPRELAEEGRAIMWRDIPFDRQDPSTWTRPVIRLPGYGGEPFRTVANTLVLHTAFDQLVGKDRWLPRDGLGTFPVRFPHPDDPGDAGWHVDLSFPGEDCGPNERHDFSSWRVNVTSRGRALLMLFLFSDVTELDAPTRIRVGSHLDMARFLEPARFDPTLHGPTAAASGRAVSADAGGRRLFAGRDRNPARFEGRHPYPPAKSCGVKFRSSTFHSP